MENQKSSKTEKLEHLRSLIKNVETVMFTTIEGNGEMRSRPMTPMEMDTENNLWFFTNESSSKIQEIIDNPKVNIAYAHPDENTYVSIKGIASVVHVRAQIEDKWSPILKAWFPEGMEDPDLALLKVAPLEAEYWDSSSSRMVQMFSMLKAAITGTEYNDGEYGRIKL